MIRFAGTEWAERAAESLEETSESGFVRTVDVASAEAVVTAVAIRLGIL
jgi:hypothetical protein